MCQDCAAGKMTATIGASECSQISQALGYVGIDHEHHPDIQTMPGKFQWPDDGNFHGVILHERYDLYEDDGITMRKNTGKTPLRIICNHPQSGGVGDAMGKLVPILRLAVSAINYNNTVLPNHIVELYLHDSECFDAKAVQSSLEPIYNNKPGFFKMMFGPLCSGATARVNDMIQVFHMFQVASISRSPMLSDGYRYPLLCRLSPTLQFAADGHMKLMQIFGWSRIGAVQDTPALSASTVNELKSAMRKAIDEGYAFDSEYLDANHYTIDNKNFHAKTTHSLPLQFPSFA